jgi:16S rRNA (guanine527-N7)-methyltransferase
VGPHAVEPAAVPSPPPAAELVFGARLPLAVRYAGLLAESGVRRGLIGPREVPRLWERHLLNCAVVGEVVAAGATVVDLGSGAGLPGLPLALARPDLEVTLLEPMARRVAWLCEVVAALELPVRVIRGRAEDPGLRRELGEVGVVTARAVAPLAKLAAWALPLLSRGGVLLAVKGETAEAEMLRDAAAVRTLGGRAARMHDCGEGIVDPLTRIVVVTKNDGPAARRAATVREKDMRRRS